MPIPIQGIALLATVKTANDDGVGKSVCFGNILELGSDALVLESKRELQIGAVLTLDVVFPGVQRGGKSVVSLGCAVVRVRDSSRLHYDLRIEDMDGEASRQLAEFMSLRRFERES